MARSSGVLLFVESGTSEQLCRRCVRAHTHMFALFLRHMTQRHLLGLLVVHLTLNGSRNESVGHGGGPFINHGHLGQSRPKLLLHRFHKNREKKLAWFLT